MSRESGPLLSGVVAAAIFSGGLTARADISGFSGFSPINTENAATTDASLGYSGGGSAFKLTSTINNEGTSGFFPTAQNISSFTATYTYTQQNGTYGGSVLNADGNALAFLPSTFSTTYLGNTGGAFGLINTSNNTFGVATDNFGGFYGYPGGSVLATGTTTGAETTLNNFGNGKNSYNGFNVNLTTQDPITVRVSYAGTNLTETYVDSVTNAYASFEYTGVNLSTILGTSTAIVGFTGATGGYNSGQTISHFQFVSSPTYSPIAVTGFNQNMIIPAGAPQSGAISSITASMDNGTANLASNVWYETGYNTAAPTTGLPASGSTFTSANDANHIFTMQSYTGTGDAIMLANGTNNVHTTGTLTLAKPAPYRALSLLESSSNGPNYFQIVINYSDGAAASTINEILAPNWFQPTQSSSTNPATGSNGGYAVAYNAQGRAVPSTTGATMFSNVNAGNPVLTQQDITLPDTTDPISSITFNYAAGGGNTAIFAVSGVTASSVSLKYGGSDPTAPGKFDNGLTQNFNNGSGNVAFVNGDTAIFDDTASGPHMVSVAAPGVLPASVIFDGSSSSYTINGPGSIGGTGSLTVGGGGVVTLNNSNSYIGATTVTAGILNIGATASLASGTLSVSGGATLNVLAGATLAASKLTLSDNGNTNLYDSTTVSALTGTGAVNLNSSGTTLTLLSGGAFTGTVNGNGVTLLLGSPGGTFSGDFTSSTGATPNSAIVNSAGTWLLTGSSQYAGGTTLTAGNAQAATDAAFGTGRIILSGGSLSSSVPVVLSNLITGGTLTIASGSNVVELSNASDTYTGPVWVLGGTLKIDAAGALGKATSIDVSGGGSFEVNDTSGSAGTGVTLTISGTGPTSTVANINNGPTGALRSVDNPPGFDVWAGGVVLNGSAYIAAGANGGLLLSGPITGTGPLVYTSNANSSAGSIIELSPPSSTSNTYTGETDILPGPNASQGGDTIALGAANGFSPASGLNFELGTPQTLTVDLGGNNQSLKYLVGANEVGFSLTSSSGSPMLTITSGLKNGVPGFFATSITGSLAIVMNDQSSSGLGSQTLSGSNTYTGGTTITRGTLTAGSASALSTTPVKLNGGTLGLAGNVSGTSALILTPASVTSTAWSINQGNTGADPAQIVSNVIQITDTSASEANSAFDKTPVTLSDKLGFTAHFTYTVLSGGSDGIAFTLQNDPRGAAAVSQGQSYEIGYGGPNQITNSAAVAFEIYTPNTHNNAGYGTAFTSGGFTPGEAGSPSTAYTPTGSVNLQGGANDVTLVYNGPAETLTETIATEGTSNTFSIVYTGVDYSALVGGTAGGATTAYLGFTGGSGGDQAAQNISNISYATNLTAPQAISNEIDAQPGTTSGIQIGLSGANSSTKGSVGLLNISSGAVVNVTVTAGSTGRGVLSPTSLTIATGSTGAFTGKLDLGGNDLDLTSSSGATLASVTAMLASGYNGGKWNGEGIASSAAANDATHLTALGVIVNDNGHGVPLYGSGGSISGTFDGSVPADGDILVKYTYYGDANLDGAVDGSDYTLIDAGFNSHGTLTGWGNGDFNYDGKIDGSDYTLIDNAFNTQGASLGSNPASIIASSTAQLAGSSAVPEPASLGLLGIGAIGLLGKRRRK